VTLFLSILAAGCARADGAEESAPVDYASSSALEATGRTHLARAERTGRAPRATDLGAPEFGSRLEDSTLARLVTEILPTVERSAGITAMAPLHVAATDETRLRTYLENQITGQLSEEEASAVTATYARLGLVPDSLDLRGLFLALLEEQVVGYYDPVTDTLFVHDRVTVEQLEPVLAHELVHALQDQEFALDSLSRALEDRNDASTASQAAMEGHATYAMMEWQWGNVTGSPADLTQLPDLGPTFANLDLSALGDIGPVDVLVGAPAIIREGMIFPYVGGLVFLQRLWKKVPARPLPFGPNLPSSTEQVLHVDRWLAGDEPTVVTFREPVDGWEEIHARDLGELETRIFLEEHLQDRARAEAAAAGWDGDAYRLLRSPAGELLLWVSVWDSDSEADEFVSAARDAYARRYDGVDRQLRFERSQVSDRPVVRILDAPPGIHIPTGWTEVDLSGGEDTGRQTGGA